MEHTQTYCYIWSDDRYISEYTIYVVISFRDIYELLLCGIWMRHAYNVMFNFGAGAENVTHLKNRTLFFVWWFWVSARIWAFGLTLRRSVLTVRYCIKDLSTKFSEVSRPFHSLNYCDLKKNILQFFIRYLMGISKYSKMLLDILTQQHNWWSSVWYYNHKTLILLSSLSLYFKVI